MKRTDHRGAVSVEAALLVPVLVLIAALATAGWRIWWASAQVQSAAEAGARVASQTINVRTAQSRVDAVVTADLRTAGVHCQPMVLRDDLAAVALPAGVAGTVWVSVSCTVELRDLLVPGLPGSVTVTGQATEAIDMFRSRQP